MKFDKTDISIIHYLHDFPKQTTSDVAKKIFDIKNSRELLKQDSFVRARLEKMLNTSVVICSSTKPKVYSTNSEKVFMGEGTLKIRVNGGGKPISIDFGHFLIVTDSEDYVYINRIANGDGNIEIKKPDAK